MQKKQQKNSSSKKPDPKKGGVSKKPKDKRVSWLIALLAFVCVVFYSNTCSNDYCLDDEMAITQNSSTQKGFAGIGEHLSQDFIYGFRHVKSKDAASSRWRPLSLITYSVEIGIWGSNKPGMSHFINMALYAWVVILLFLFLYRYVLKDEWLAFFTALIFAIHPVHSEVVANIKSRDELLSLLFLLLSLHQFWKFLNVKRRINQVLAFVFYFISLTAKENALTFIAGIPVMLYFFTGYDRKKILIYTSGFFATAIFYLIIRNAIVPLSNLNTSPELMNNPFLKATGLEPICTKIYIMLLYLKLLVFPHPLIFDYSYNQIPYVGPGSFKVWISVLVNLSLLTYALLEFKKKNILSFCILMFFITISISSNFVVEIGGTMAERFLFLPSVFFCIALVVIFKRIIEKIHSNFNIVKPIAISIFMAPVFIASAYATISRNADWKNQNILSVTDVPKAPENALINSAAGKALIVMADDTTVAKNVRDSMLRTSLVYLNKSIEVYPGYNDALINKGVAYMMLDSVEKAEQYWSVVRERFPNHPRMNSINLFLANKFINLGKQYGFRNSFDTSIYYLNKAMKYSEGYDSLTIDLWYNFGGLYYSMGDYEKAYENFGKVVQRNPNYLNVQNGYKASEYMLMKKGD